MAVEVKKTKRVSVSQARQALQGSIDVRVAELQKLKNKMESINAEISTLRDAQDAIEKLGREPVRARKPRKLREVPAAATLPAQAAE